MCDTFVLSMYRQAELGAITRVCCPMWRMELAADSLPCLGGTACNPQHSSKLTYLQHQNDLQCRVAAGDVLNVIKISPLSFRWLCLVSMTLHR